MKLILAVITVISTACASGQHVPKVEPSEELKNLEVFSKVMTYDTVSGKYEMKVKIFADGALMSISCSSDDNDNSLLNCTDDATGEVVIMSQPSYKCDGIAL